MNILKIPKQIWSELQELSEDCGLPVEVVISTLLTMKFEDVHRSNTMDIQRMTHREAAALATAMRTGGVPFSTGFAVGDLCHEPDGSWTVELKIMATGQPAKLYNADWLKLNVPASEGSERAIITCELDGITEQGDLRLKLPEGFYSDAHSDHIYAENWEALEAAERTSRP